MLPLNVGYLFTIKFFSTMKNALLISLVLLFGFTACQNKQHNHDESKPETSTTAEPATTATATPQVAYACPMHPEVTGKAGDKCPKCKMDLQPVKK